MSFLDPYLVDPLRPLANNWQLIRSEYDQVSNKASKWPEPIHNGQWNVIGLRFMGSDLATQLETPITKRLCEKVPGVVTFGFSIMEPGCVIAPHRGYTNEVLRIHLGIYVNKDAAIQVGDDKRVWREGHLLMFDDTQVHSAWNYGTEKRVILLLDIKRSEICSYLQ